MSSLFGLFASSSLNALLSCKVMKFLPHYELFVNMFFALLLVCKGKMSVSKIYARRVHLFLKIEKISGG